MKKAVLRHILFLIAFSVLATHINVFSISDDSYKNHETLYDDTCKTAETKLEYDTEVLFEYKLYTCYKDSKVSFKKFHKNGGSFNELTQMQTHWVFVKENEIEHIATDEKYSEFTRLIREDSIDVTLEAINSALIQLGTDFNDENLTVKVVWCPHALLKCKIVYFNLSGKEYFMHISNSELFAIFENHKLYDISELYKYLDKHSKDVYKDELMETKHESRDFVITYTYVLIVVLLLSVFTVYLIKKYRKNQE